MRIVPILAFLSLSAMAESPVPVRNSQSPDAHYALVIVPDSSGDGASGTLKIRDTATQKLSGAFEWGSFGLRVSEDSIDAVLWSSDSRCFAISWPVTRGYMGCALYAHSSRGWNQLPLPNYMSRIFKRSKVIEGMPAKGCETPKKWIAPNRLRIEVANQNIQEPSGGDTMQLFWLTIAIETNKKTHKPVATLKTIELAPESAYER